MAEQLFDSARPSLFKSYVDSNSVTLLAPKVYLQLAQAI